uniref:Uncharacterized protein n=1 Tax=Lates calcarifer TaxID=8187 RepID=A0A4W6EZH2_LATCA
MINWKALDNVPVLLYILALKTLLLCLGFAGVKIYQSKKAEEALRKKGCHACSENNCNT